MFQHIVYSLTNRQGLFAYVRTCKTRLDTTTKFMVVVTSLFNLVISSFPDNMFYHVWTWLLIYHDGSNNVVQVYSFIKPWTTEQSVPTCMNKPVNNHVQAGQLNHVQTGQLNHVQASQVKPERMFCMAHSNSLKCIFAWSVLLSWMSSHIYMKPSWYLSHSGPWLSWYNIALQDIFKTTVLRTQGELIYITQTYWLSCHLFNKFINKQE